MDHSAGTIRLDHIDNLLTDNINPDNSINPRLAQKIAAWKESLDSGYHLLLASCATAGVRYRRFCVYC